MGGSPLINAFAIISVTYPQGSICTCTNGQRTLRAIGTNGVWAFGVPSGGDWTVIITNGEKISSRVVSGVEQYNTYNLAITYELWLYKDGHEYPDTTGGWSVISTSGGNGHNVSKQSTYFDATLKGNGYGNGNYWGTFYTNTKIDVTSYTKLVVNPEWYTANTGSGCYARIGLTSVSLNQKNPTFVAALTSIGSTELDISEVKGTYTIAFYSYSDSTAGRGVEGRITSIHLA